MFVWWHVQLICFLAALTITKSYPCRNTRFDRQRAGEVERDIQKMMIQDQVLLVGWYHSHPKFQAEPTLRDCDAQLDYQIRMRGVSDLTYTPCVSLIICKCAKFYVKPIVKLICLYFSTLL